MTKVLAKIQFGDNIPMKQITRGVDSAGFHGGFMMVPNYRDYFNDFNSLHAIIERMNVNDLITYWDELYKLCSCDVSMLIASCEQMAEAIIKTYGEWK